MEAPSITVGLGGEIHKISYDMPMIAHEQCKRYTGQYRSVHRICESFDEAIKRDLKIM